MSAWSLLMPSLLDTVLAGTGAAVQRLCVRILLTVLAVFVATCGFVVLVGSAFLWLSESLSTQVATAVTGGGLLAAAGLIALAALLVGRGRLRRPTLKSTEGSTSRITDLLAAMETTMGRDASANAPGVALIALLVGCAVGASPGLRRAIADLAR